MSNTQTAVLLLGLWISIPWTAFMHQVTSIVIALWKADEIKMVDQRMLEAIDLALEDYPDLNEGVKWRESLGFFQRELYRGMCWVLWPIYWRSNLRFYRINREIVLAHATGSVQNKSSADS